MKNNPRPTPWHSRQQAAEYLRCTVWTIDRFKREGRLVPLYRQRAPLYHQKALDALLTRKPQAAMEAV